MAPPLRSLVLILSPKRPLIRGTDVPASSRPSVPEKVGVVSERHTLNTPDRDAVQRRTRWVPRGWPGGLGRRSHQQRLPPGASLGLPDLLELSLVEPGVAEAVLLLLTEDLQLQEQLLLLEQPGVGGIHGRRGLLGLLVRGDVLVIFELLHLWLGFLGLFVAVLTVAQGLGLQSGWRNGMCFR